MFLFQEKVGISIGQLKKKLKSGRRAKERMVAANLRLVVSDDKKYKDLPKTYSINQPTRTAIVISPIIFYLNKEISESP